MKTNDWLKIPKTSLVILSIYSLRAFSFENSHSYFQMEKVSYENAVRNEVNNSDALGLDLDKVYLGNSWHTKIDFKGRFLVNNSRPVYSLQEFYINKNWENSQLWFGRRLLDWNENETFWMLGQVNGVSNINFLEPDREGLFGINYSHEIGKFKVEGFLSYFYVPNLNPALDVVNGRVINYGTWGRTPPKFTAISGKRTEINYRVNRPDTKDILFKKSLGGKISYQNNFLNISFYGIYKPESNLRMNAEAYAELDATVTAVANPLVNHHGIYGTGLEIISDNILWRTNIQVVDPNVRLAGDFEIVDPFKLQQDNRQFTSEFFSVRPNYQKQSYFTSELLINNYNHQIGLYGVYLLEGRDSLGDDFLSDAPKWHTALGASLKIRYKRWFTTGSYQYDLQQSDQVLQFASSYYLNKYTSFGLGGKLLRSPRVQSYWYQHRAEDQTSVFFKRFF